jgi:hypothetical protein
MTEASGRDPPGTMTRPGLLYMLQQPSRVAYDVQDGAGRGFASAALLAGSSSQRTAGAAYASTPRQDTGSEGMTGANAPVSGAKTFLETAKRSLDKAAYVKVRRSWVFARRCVALGIDFRVSTVSVAAQGIQV